MVVQEDTSKSAGFWNTQTNLSSTEQPLHVESHINPHFFFHSDAQFEL